MTSSEPQKKASLSSSSSIKIGKYAFLGAAGIILVLMIVAGILGKSLPSGFYERETKNGVTLIVPGSYHETEKPDYPVWRWMTAPVEVLTGSDNLAIITIILFIIFVGGSFAILEKAGVMADLLGRLVKYFSHKKYILMGIIIFLFMFLAAFLGIYEGMVPLIIFIVPLSLSLGWDSLTGLGISLLPMAFGFAAAVTNPFTIAVAQNIAELPLFSGSWLRIIFFITVYILVYLFVSSYARKVEANPEKSLCYKQDQKLRAISGGSGNIKEWEESHPGMKKALWWFGSFMGLAILLVLVTSQVPAISDLAFPVMGLLFLIGGIGAGIFARMKGMELTKTFFMGALGLLPGVILIMMAYSVKHIIDQSHITDTILYSAASSIEGAGTVKAAFMIYGLTLGMNFFIGSASAKAFLMMPILTPLADLVGITRQTAILAFDFGDGFSNMLFPSNALLLIALGFTVVSYPKWIRWTWKLQLAMLAVTCIFLYIAVLINYGPF